MDVVEIFYVLGIEPTKDERIIKNAYREKLVITNPEDDPEGFKRLRAAFDAANAYAAEQEDETTEEEVDLTPSGRWVAKVADIYKNIKTRCNPDCWKPLFEEDVFISLEDEEECRTKLLVFLMDHFRLPTNVWKLLDEKLNILKDAESLAERFHVDFVSYIANKCERGEDIDFESFSGAEDADYDGFLQYYDRAWRALENEEYDQAEEMIALGDKLGITHPAMDICRAHLYDRQGKKQEARRLMEQLAEKYPKDTMAIYNAAELLWEQGEKEKAAAYYKQLKEQMDTHYMANVRLTEWYYEQGDYSAAKKCAEKVLPAGADDAFMKLLTKVNEELEKELEKRTFQDQDTEAALELCWCYLQDGKVHAGIRIAKSLQGKIPKERDAEYKGLLTKLYIEEASYEEASEMAVVWEKALEEKLLCDEEDQEREKDQDRIRQSHMIRMECFRYMAHDTEILQKGESRKYFDAAIEETQYMETHSLKDVNMLMEKAQVYMEMEEYEKSLEVCRHLIERYRIYVAFVTQMEVFRKEWDAGGVLRAGAQCINVFPEFAKPYEYMAKVYLDLNQRTELEQLLADAKKANIKSVILDAYAYQMEHTVPDTDWLNQKLREFHTNYVRNINEGKLSYYEQGLPIITEYLYFFPGTYMLVERGNFHRSAHKLQEAQEDYEKALGENPYHPYALSNLSFVYRYRGEYDNALVCLKKALRYREEEMLPGIYYDLATVYSLLGDYKEACLAYEQYMNLLSTPEQKKSAMLTYSTFLMRCDDFDKAEKVLLYHYDGENAEFYRNMVDGMQWSGQGERAYKYLDKWGKMLGLTGLKLLIGSEKPNDQQLIDFYQRSGWQALLYGNKKDAVKFFDKMVKVKSILKDREGSLADAIFAYILCGEEKQARKCAETLSEWLKQQKHSSISKYYDRQKAFLQIRFLAGYYTLSDEELEKILEEDRKAEICYFCDQAVCKEMEAVRILFLIKKGNREEALQRLERSLKLQPQDEYMLALRRYIC